MTQNVGLPDRLFRLIVGMYLIAIAYYRPVVGLSALDNNLWLGWAGMLPLLSAILGSCPFFTLIGFSSKTIDA